jgi:hypothetical protein
MKDADGLSNGNWNQQGNNVTIRFAGNVVYTGVIQGNRIQGTATNGQKRWNWTVSK